MLQVGCGSVGLIFACAMSPATASTAPLTPIRMLFMTSSRRVYRTRPALRELLTRPRRSLHLLSDGTGAFIHEPLHARAGVRLGRVEIALRVGIEIVDAEELSRLPSTVAEGGDDFERAAQHDVDVLVHAIGHIDVRLLRIAGQRHVP